MRVRGGYGFSSLLKQNKKAKICFVIYIAGFFFKKNFCYEVFAKQKKKKCSSSNYSYMNTCMYSVHVCMFVNVLLIRNSLSLMHHMCVRMPLKDTCTHSCIHTHTCRTG
jgi:hypothetical protein